MKRKSKIEQFNGEVIDLFDIIRILIKERFLILALSFSFTIAGLVYSMNIPSKFYATITVVGFSDSTSSMFHYYDQATYFESNNIKTDSRDDLKNNLSNELVREILYTTNFEKFIKSNKVADPLIKHLKEKEITIEEYIRDRDNLEKTELNKSFDDDNLLSQFIFNFPEDVNGDEILNEYTYSISLKVLKNFLLNIESILIQKLNKKNRAINIAKEMGIVLPDNTSLQQDEYLKGSKLLSMEIKNLDREIDFLKNSLEQLQNQLINNDEILISNPSFSFKWQPIVYKPFVQEYAKSTIQNTILSCILGFILSLMIIFIKVNFKRVFKK